MATKPTKTKTKKPIIDIPASGENDQLPSAPKDNRPSAPDNPTGNRASKSRTKAATSRMTPTDDMRNMLDRLRDLEIEPDIDDPGYPDEEEVNLVPITPENLPKIIERSLKKSGEQNPEWHVVANLPGNMSQVIRTVGRRLFRQFTETPTDQIVMIGDLNGMGPNTTPEVKAVAGWLKNEGERLSDGEINFSHIMDGYMAKYVMYSKDGVRYMVVKDEIDGRTVGHYIYTWPDEDSLLESKR